MKTTYILSVALLALSVSISWAAEGSSASTPVSQTGAEASTTYVCPMHPHIHGGPEDTCTVCGMYLVPQQDLTNPNADKE